ncbi:unnamed protein product [Lathyrus sativus]|nr:unnamed protein product [Lathyrus sativus]
MENSLPVISKRIWSMVRVAFFMLRKKLSKGQVMNNLNMMLRRRGKLAGKAIANLMFHHNQDSSSSRHFHNSFTSSREYKLSCSSFTPTQALPTPDDEAMTMRTMKTVLNMLNNDQAIVEASPVLSGFEHSPRVRQLRVTDSPFPLIDDEKDNQIDKAAEDFIKKFYRQLRQQD